MRYLAALVLSLLLALTGCTAGDAAGPALPSVPDSTKIRAVTFDARHPPEPEALQRLKELGATHITLVSFGFQQRVEAPRIRMHTDAGWYSESDAGIHALAQQARSLDLGLILKPHIWVGDYSAAGQNRSDIAFDTEPAWTRWEDDYRRFLMHYARLADSSGADVLVVGTELERVVAARPDFWRGLIDSVRAVYDGQLTYAANWYEAYQQVPFWRALDFVGVQAYFPISEADNPSLSALRSGWVSHRSALQRVAAEVDRPILFTELGYRSVEYAAEKPWTWPRREESRERSPDYALQADLYRAFFDEVMPAPWFAGAILWKWHPASEGDRPLGFTPQDKPAEAVIRDGFARSRD
jgi:hypothetical protein